jgi:hypothetical protein
VFLADYFVNEAFRRELPCVLNRGESVNSLKRSIYVGRVAGYQAKQQNEMQAVADALSLLAWKMERLRYTLKSPGKMGLSLPALLAQKSRGGLIAVRPQCPTS